VSTKSHQIGALGVGSLDLAGLIVDRVWLSRSFGPIYDNNRTQSTIFAEKPVRLVQIVTLRAGRMTLGDGR
jgi:hypothetical protein